MLLLLVRFKRCFFHYQQRQPKEIEDLNFNALEWVIKVAISERALSFSVIFANSIEITSSQTLFPIPQAQ